MPSIDRTLCLARGAIAALAALALIACGGAVYQVGDLTYDLSSAEKGFADTWVRTAPQDAAEACRYWDARQKDAGKAHQRTARPVGDYRQLRLWTQAQRIAACKAAGASDETPRTLPDPGDAPPPAPALPSEPQAEDAPAAPGSEPPPANEDAPL